MRSLKHRELAFLLVGSLAAATPTFAKDGSDKNGSNGSSGNSSSGTSGTSSTSCSINKINSSSSSSSTSSSRSNAKSKCSISLNNTLPVAKASFKKTASRKGSKQKIELKLKIGKNGPITQDNFNNDIGALSAIFPGNIVCEMAGVNQSKKSFTYLLKAKERNGVVDVRVGTCVSNAMPVLGRGDTIGIQLDVDGDAATTTDIVDVGTIRFR